MKIKLKMINLIFSGIYFKQKFAIGKNGDLIVSIKDDLKFFQNLTSNVSTKVVNYHEPESTLKYNVLLMGKNTWLSLPSNKKPLKNRINLVLTHDTSLCKKHSLPKDYSKCKTDTVYYITMKTFLKFYEKTRANVYVIGGSNVLNYFIDKSLADYIYLTEIYIDKQFVLDADTFVNVFSSDYKLISISEKKYQNVFSYRHLTYKLDTSQRRSNEQKYIELCKNIIVYGEHRSDRTLTGTVSVFGKQLHFDISKSIPLLTTKFVPWKHVIEELLWFMRGDTDSKILSKKGVKIWDGNTSREFLDSRGLYLYDEGILGKGYGWQWRFFGAKYSPIFADTSTILNRHDIGGFDQLQYIIDEIKTNRYSRRILMCYWNPCDLDKTALPPCHFSCQFYVHTNDKLDCHFTMRSTDCGLGLPFNIASYAIFTYIIALQCNLNPGKLIYTGGDVHIYSNHIKGLLTQFEKTPRPEPCILIDKRVGTKKIEYIDISDFELVGYYPHPSVKLTMAV